MSFVYVKIPCGSESPVEELTASKAGGLEHDELVANAKAYFAGPDADEANAKKKKNPFSTCDIMALTIPMPGNRWRAVSLYASDDSAGLPENPRATKLVTACGHSLREPIRGDVFVGRAHDNEEADVWEREDFPAEDAAATASWCAIARSDGGGGGRGGAASSLGGILKQQLSASEATHGAPTVVEPPHAATPLYGSDGAPAVAETWGQWTQTSDEVEARLVVPSTTTSKTCKIGFKRNALSVVVGGETLLEGSLFAAVVPDECTYTMEPLGTEHKELCVTLAKAQEGTTWSFLTAA